MPDTKTGATQTKGQEICLDISLQAVPSKLEVSVGREITFTRAMLSMVNTGRTALVGVVPHAAVAQERGIVHDATEALSRVKIVESIQPGETVKWDVYDLLFVAHPGVASKVHLWGHKAVLDWWLDFVAWAEYRTSDVATPQQTPKHQWRLRWSPAKSQPDEIDLTLEVTKD
jgi:plastocyanin